MQVRQEHGRAKVGNIETNRQHRNIQHGRAARLSRVAQYSAIHDQKRLYIPVYSYSQHVGYDVRYNYCISQTVHLLHSSISLEMTFTDGRRAEC